MFIIIPTPMLICFILEAETTLDLELFEPDFWEETPPFPFPLSSRSSAIVPGCMLGCNDGRVTVLGGGLSGQDGRTLGFKLVEGCTEREGEELGGTDIVGLDVNVGPCVGTKVGFLVGRVVDILAGGPVVLVGRPVVVVGGGLVAVDGCLVLLLLLLTSGINVSLVGDNVTGIIDTGCGVETGEPVARGDKIGMLDCPTSGISVGGIRTTGSIEGGTLSTTSFVG
jgi:hypothetical protein